MDPLLKLYFPTHEVNTKRFLHKYFSQNVPYSIFKESTIDLMKCCYKAFSSGLVSGKTVTDISIGPIIGHILSVCEFVEEISILEVNDASFRELNMWKDKAPDAFDWTPTLKLFMELKGKSRDGWKDAEKMLRRKIKHVVKCDFSKSDPTKPFALPKADCVTCIWALEVISRDRDEFKTNLRKFSDLVKLGGHVLIYAAVNASYFKVGEDKYQLANFDDNSLRKTLTDGGFAIEHYENLEREITTDCVDHRHKAFVVARKVTEA